MDPTAAMPTKSPTAIAAIAAAVAPPAPAFFIGRPAGIVVVVVVSAPIGKPLPPPLL
jgi:hypothetical protein